MAARDKLIVGTIDLIRRKGVAATGLTELLERSGISRRTIYLNFPGGKAEMVTEATRVAGHTITGLIQEVTATTGPQQSLDAIIDWWKHSLLDSTYTAGCPLMAATLGRSVAPGAAAAAAASFAEWEHTLATHLHTQGVAPATAQSLATTTIAAVEGAVVLCLASGDTEPLDRIHVHLSELLELHLAEAAQPDSR